MKLQKQLNEFLNKQFVLVIEPALNYRTSIKNFMNNLKVKNVRYVGSVAEAKREMLTIKVGLFIVEWQMPEKNGLEFCREMRQQAIYKTTPFLLLSTENLRADVVLASEGGIDSYLLKPFAFTDFCSQISQLLASIKFPSSLNSLLERAEAHLNQNDIWVAETLFKEALNIKPTSAKALCGLGCVEMERANIPAALAHFRAAIVNNPDYVDSYKFMLQIAETRSDYLGVLQAATVLHSISPENPRYPLLIAHSHLELKNLTESEHFFKVCIRLSPLLAAGHKGLGNLYFLQKDFQKSRKFLERALDLDAGDVAILNSLGMAYVRLDMVDEGIKKYRVALAINSDDARVLFNLGLALEIKNDLEKAADAFRKALAADPTLEKAKKNLERISVILTQSDKKTPSDNTQSAQKIGANTKKTA